MRPILLQMSHVAYPCVCGLCLYARKHGRTVQKRLNRSRCRLIGGGGQAHVSQGTLCITERGSYDDGHGQLDMYRAARCKVPPLFRITACTRPLPALRAVYLASASGRWVHRHRWQGKPRLMYVCRAIGDAVFCQTLGSFVFSPVSTLRMNYDSDWQQCVM